MKYDPVRHAKALVKSDGVCDGHAECDNCFRNTFGKHFGCSQKGIYEDALKFLKKTGNIEKCASIW